MKEQLISDEDIRNLVPAFRKKGGDKFLKLSRQIAGIDKACLVYDRSKHLTGIDFAKDLLDKLKLRRTVVNAKVLEQFKDKPFITVSNHPNGHVDGIALIETVGSRVDNYKVMVNFILSLVDTLEENFITVNPYKESTQKHISLSGIKESISHLHKGNPMGFFPAGSVSRMKFRKGRVVIEDREWQLSIMKLIQKAKVPVIPIHIDCRNSYPFYATRFIHWTLQTLALCHEILNKKNKEMILTFGEPIMPDEIEKHDSIEELAIFLQKRTYLLAKKR